ncbi:class II aldolase/adducin family protein [Cohnella xylanilytica]|uniref:Class II aldolase/adducin family protein n=1 Tax=Cohnella xylanilytica TaxID=557555 RepID=A0A841U7W2_9BACL|nr:class II aldolase/adducin family protein [Cohnella xylanilytica]MBB6695118.1 class II aldolase/adducin family protein [Cohnella xylanilytica]
MNFDYLHPADQIIRMIERIYRYGMTTTSGGNLSILDENGDIWITPGGVDKGSLGRADIVRVTSDGRIDGRHKPSSEFPFHQAIYRSRPDLRAIVHAHPPSLVSFSIVRRVPNVGMLPGEREICGEVGMADYALPGSDRLGANIARVFAEGKHAVMLENHGGVVGGTTLMEAFKTFETLEFCARTEILARRIGTPRAIASELLEKARIEEPPTLSEFEPDRIPTDEREARRDMCELIHRAYEQRLFTSTQGTFSVKLGDDRFLITPHGLDRKILSPEDLVLIDRGRAEKGKSPSRSALLHRRIYERQPHIRSVLVSHSPHVMAFAVTERKFDSRTIPESYILLRSLPKLPFLSVYEDAEGTADRFTPDVPVAVVENNCVIATGNSLLQAFDRLEVAEYSAKSIIEAEGLGAIAPIDEASIRELEEAFRL